MFHRTFSQLSGTTPRSANSNRTYLRYGEAPAAFRAAVFPNTREIGAMGLFSKDIKTMNDLFVHQLRDIEKQLVNALPEMAEKATDERSSRDPSR
jgi:hypothetical protein